MPGFRPGKAPRRLLEARMGTEIARDQALRDSLPEYYAEAVVAEDVDVIAPPEIDITAGEEEGDVEFDAVVEVRPVVTVEGHGALRIEIERPDVDDEAIARQVDGLRERFADLEDSDAPLTDGDFAEIDIKGFVDDESVEGLTATDYLYEVGSGIVVAAARRGAARQAPRRHPQVHRHAARALRRARRRRGLLPGPGEGDEEEGAAGAHRRMGERGQRVRERRGAPGRRPQAPRRLRARAGVDGDAREDLRSGRRARPRRRPRHAREQRDGASPPRPRPSARGAGDQDDDPAVPRGHGSGPAGVRRQREGRRDRGRTRRPRAACGDRPGGDRRDRRRGRGRGRPPGRTARREARQGPQGSRTAGGRRGGTLGHRTRQGARVPDGPRGSGRCRRRTRRPLPPATRSSAEGSEEGSEGAESDGPAADEPAEASEASPAQEAPEEEPAQ